MYIKYILGKKLGMTTLYDKEQGALNVTLIECPVNTVSVIRTQEKNGYSAVQLELAKTKNVTHRKEFRLDEDAKVAIGDQITVETFAIGDEVQISDTVSLVLLQRMVTSMTTERRDQLELSNHSMLSKEREWLDVWVENDQQLKE